MTVTPALNSDEDFSLTISEIGVDGAQTGLGFIDIDVKGIADAADLSFGDNPIQDSGITEIPININTALTDTDGSETLSLTITGIPAGVTLSAGTPNDDGSWSLTPDQLSGLKALKSDGFSAEDDLSLTVTATTTELDGGDSTSVSSTLEVTVDDIADPPTLDLDSVIAGEQLEGAASGLEDTAIPLDIRAELNDPLETMSITISGVPDGATLSAGTLKTDLNGNPLLDVNGNATWTLTQADLNGLTITPAPDSDADFDLSMTATSIDGTDTFDVSGTISVDVTGVADAPTVTVHDASGAEDTAIPLDISSALTDTDGSETLSVSISGVPAGATLSAGTYDAATDTWTLSQGELNGLTVTPAPNSDADFDLTVTATSTEADGDTAVTTGTVSVDVTGVADAATLDLDAAGDGDPSGGAGATTVPLDITSGLTDTDGSETLSITITGVPAGATLSAGAYDPATDTWTLSEAELSGLSVDSVGGLSDDFTLTVTATTTEIDGGDTTSVSGTIPVTIEAGGGPDAPTLDLDSLVAGDQLTGEAAGDEDTSILLDISAELTDPTEELSITISGVPSGAVLSAGTETPVGSGNWVLDPAAGDLSGLTITPALNSDDDFSLTVTATSTDGTDTATTTGTIAVSVDAVADAPTLVLNAASGDEDTGIPLDITSALTDTDGSETLSITISGVPSGAVLSAGTETPVGSGNWVLDPAAGDLSGLTITPALNSDDDFSLTVTATSIDGTDTFDVSGTISVDVTGVADAATLDLDSAGDGDPSAGAGATTIPLDITSGLTDTDGSETLTITITGVPAGATLSAGAYDPATDTWTLSEADLSGLSVGSVGGLNDDFTLTVTATTTEIDGGNSTSVSGTIPVTIDDVGGPDAPTLDLNSLVAGDQLTGEAAGDEDTSILLDISADLTDPTEELSITIGDIPDGATISIVNPSGEDVDIPVINGEAFIPSGLFELGGDIKLTPPPNSDEDFQLTVTATSTDSTGASASTTGTIDVDVAAIADEPQLQVIEATTGDEDTAIALDITASLTDTDGSETLSVTIAGVPDGATLSAGTKNPDGSWTLAPAMLIGLTITPPKDSNEDFQLSVTATSVELDGGDTSTTDPVTIDVDVIGVADAPTLDVSVSQGVPGGISSEPAAADPTPDDSSQHQIIGTEGDDIIVGENKEEFIDGGAGDDIIVGGDGNDMIDGGKGHDELFGGDGNDIIEGGEGADEIYGGEGNDFMEGGEGADILSGGAGDDFIDGGRFHEGGEGGGHYHDGSQGDVVLFTGPRDNYMITENDDGSFTVLDMFAGRDGTDTVINVENFQFGDGITTEENLIATNPTTFVLDIDAALTDTDGSETLSITVSGLPEGAFLTFGTQNDDGTWTLTPEEAAESGLGIIVPHDVQADFSLSVAATSTENDGSTNTVTQVVPLDADAAAPTLDLDSDALGDQLAGAATGDEDAAIELDISSSLVDTDGSETLSITIGDVPAGATLSAGTDNGDGTWTLDPADLANLTVTPAADSDADFQLTVTATASEDTDGTASTTGTIDVSVTGVADAPVATAQDETGAEDSWIQLHLDSALTDTDGSETLSITITGVPEGAILSPGTDLGDGVWSATPAQLPLVCILPPDDFSGDINMTLSVTSTENDGDSATTVKDFSVEVTAVADTPTVTVSDASGTEDQPISLDISSALTDTDGSETLSVTVAGVPDGATLSAGTDNGDGTWTLDPADLANLTVTPAADSDADFTLTVTASTTATDGTDTATTTGTLDVSVAADADTPTLDLNAGVAGDQSTGTATGDADTAISLDISSALTDTDGSESLSVTISGVPTGATLSAGTDNGDGTWTLDPANGDLNNLNMTPPLSFSGAIALAVVATALDGTDTAAASGAIDVTVTAPTNDDTTAEDPTLTVGPVAGLEDTAIALDISSALTDTDGSETLSVSIAGVPAGATLSAGTDNGDGSWTIDGADVAGLTITPPEDSNVDFDLTVTATSTESSSGDTASTTATVSVDLTGVADTPTLSADVTFSETSGVETTLDLPQSILDAATGDNVVTVSGVPAGAALSAGTDNGDGTWTLSAADVDGVTFTPADGATDTVSLSFDVTGAGSGETLVSEDFNTGVSGWSGGMSSSNDAMKIDHNDSASKTFDFGAEHAGQTVTISFDNDANGSWDESGSYQDYFYVTANGEQVLSTSQGDASHSSTVTLDQNGQAQIDMSVDATSSSEGIYLDNFQIVSGDDWQTNLESASVDVVPDTGLTYDLDIASALTDTDGSETLSITAGGVPSGASLSAGTDNGDGTWTVEPDNLSGLTMEVAAGTEDFNLTVIATATEDDGDSASVSASAEVVIPDTTAEDPTLTVGPVAGLEDTAIALDITSALTDTDGSETLSVNIAGVPTGATLSAGTYDAATDTWTLDPATGDLNNLTISPPDDSNVDFDLTVTATSTETSTGDTSTNTATVSVDLTGVADTPTVFTQIAPDSASYQDAVGAREPIAYWRMNEGDDDEMVDSVGSLDGEYHKGAESKTIQGGIGEGTGDFDGRNDHITVDHGESLELSSGSITLWFNSDDVDDKQGLFSKDSSGYDDGGHLTAFVDDGEVRVRLQSGEDSFWVDGGNLSDNTWHQVTFNWGEGGMELYVDGELVDTNDYTGGIENNTEPLVIGANSWASDDGEADHLRDYFDGQIDEVAIMDHPLSVDDVSSLYMTGGHAIQDNGGTVGGTLTDSLTFNLEITAALGDLDGSESLAIVIGDVPDGASLSAGTDNGDGTWTLQPDDLSDLTLNTDHTVIENFELTVTAVAMEDDGDTATTLTSVPVIVDATVDADVSIQGSRGDDELLGGGGDDTLYGSSGADTLDGGSGDDTLFGSSGKDVLKGGEGDDYLDGGSKDDVLDGGAGNDFIKGGRGDDELLGGAGSDTIEGGEGSDVITGGAGNDVLEGGEGADTFVFDSESGHDIVNDILEQDVLVFEGQEFHMDDLVLSENNEGDVVVTFGGVEDTSVTLDGVSLDDLDQNHDGDPSDGYTVSDDGSGISITIDNVG